MKKKNSKFIVSPKCMIESRPELFNFNLHTGRNISLILKNDIVKCGVLLGLVEGGTVMMDIVCPLGMALSETELIDVSEIFVVD